MEYIAIGIIAFTFTISVGISFGLIIISLRGLWRGVS
jgi:hypothetical protein